MKVLVTGAAGFVGCVLVPKLLAAGHDVVAYDIMYYGDEGLKPSPKLQIVAADLRSIDAFKKAVSAGACCKNFRRGRCSAGSWGFIPPWP